MYRNKLYHMYLVFIQNSVNTRHKHNLLVAFYFFVYLETQLLSVIKVTLMSFCSLFLMFSIVFL